MGRELDGAERLANRALGHSARSPQPHDCAGLLPVKLRPARPPHYHHQSDVHMVREHTTVHHHTDSPRPPRHAPTGPPTRAQGLQGEALREQLSQQWGKVEQCVHRLDLFRA